MDPKRNRNAINLLISLLILTTGCDDRVTQVAREAADRQALQNTTMAELHQDVAAGTKRLIEADAQVRDEFANSMQILDTERSQLVARQDELERERKEIARERRTESVLVPAITIGGGIALMGFLLGYCWYVLVGLRSTDSVAVELSALLVEELITPQSSGTEACQLANVKTPAPSGLLPRPEDQTY